MFGKKILLSATAAAALLVGAHAAMADCEVTVGLVMELTGPAGEYGQAGTKSVGKAFRAIKEGGVGHWRHPPLGPDPDPHFGDGARACSAGLAGFLLTDADAIGARWKDQ